MYEVSIGFLLISRVPKRLFCIILQGLFSQSTKFHQSIMFFIKKKWKFPLKRLGTLLIISRYKVHIRGGPLRKIKKWPILSYQSEQWGILDFFNDFRSHDSHLLQNGPFQRWENI